MQINEHNGKILLVGDPHLGVRSNNEKYINCFKDYFLNYLKEIIVEHKTYDVRILGDFFNDRNTLNVQTLNTGLEIFQHYYQYNKNIIFTILIGNHDIYYNNTLEVNSLNIFDFYPNVRIIKDVTIENIKNKTIVSVPWLIPNTNTMEKFLKLTKSNTIYDVLLGHLEINECMPIEAQNENSPFKISLFKNFKRVFSGHIHKRIIQDNICYVGTPYEFYWSDYNTKKGLHIINLNNDSVEFIENNYSPKHIIFKLSQIRNDFKKIKNQIKNNIIKLIIDEKAEEKDIIDIISNIENLQPFKLDIENINNNQITANVIEDKHDSESIKSINVDPLNFVVDFINNTEFNFEKTNKNIILNLIKEEYMNKISGLGG